MAVRLFAISLSCTNAREASDQLPLVPRQRAAVAVVRQVERPGLDDHVLVPSRSCGCPAAKHGGTKTKLGDASQTQRCADNLEEPFQDT